MRLWITFAMSIVVCSQASGEGTRLVENHRSRAVIVIPDKASGQNKDAAQLLAKYVNESSGATMEVVLESDPNDVEARIHVGPTRFAMDSKIALEGLDDDGFVIHPVDNENLVIVGPSDWGTEFGVYEFLEAVVGVRWLMPGEFGTHVPKRADIVGPEQDVRQEPVAFSRLMSGFPAGVQSEWARRNRMHGRISFHHNLLNLFPPETYAKSHPEFFPIHDGKRFLPTSNDQHGWQPCFSADGIVEEAVKNINRYFATHPDADSFSLGVNDSGGDCECEACQAKDSGATNLSAVRDVSDRFFEWCDKVVTEVSQTYPDKTFGCLAYRQILQPPRRVKLHHQIIPFLTYDRMRWADPELRKRGHELNEAWQKACPTMGWYEYLYGTPYLVPRVYFHQMAANYRYAARHGVRAHYAEAYPNWAEGPKLYLALKLQWNPDRDVDELLNDWYQACVGVEAAPLLREYYDLWEQFWTSPELMHGAWFNSHATVEYLNFYSPKYLALISPEMIQKSRSLLESAISATRTPEQKARAKFLLRAFEYHEATFYAYHGSLMHFDEISDEDDALKFIELTVKNAPMAEKRARLLCEFEHDPVLVQLPEAIQNQYHCGLRSEAWGVGSLWPVYPWLRESERIRQKLEEVSKSGWNVYATQASNILEKWNAQQDSP